MKKARKLLRFNIDIVNHCNLNCLGCGHFSPLAKESYLSVEIFKNDCIRLNELTGGIIERIELMGGEPLLHPNIISLMEIARENFSGEINICTNGILLDKQTPSFYEACSKLDISVAVTIYPITLDWIKIKRLAKKYNFNLIKVGTNKSDKRLWYKNHRDLLGKQNVESNFMKCRWGNNCIILENGRLATCVMPFKSVYYNEFYKINSFQIAESDSINIYDVNNIDDILDFLSNPISCCRYCMPDNDELIDWKISKRKLEEWS